MAQAHRLGRGTQAPRDDPAYAMDAPPPDQGLGRPHETPAPDRIPANPFFVWVRQHGEPDAVGERYHHQIRAWDALDGYQRDLVGHGAVMAVEIQTDNDEPTLTTVRRNFVLTTETVLIVQPGACSGPCGRWTFGLKLGACPRCSSKKPRLPAS